MRLYDNVAELPLRVEEYETELHERETSSGFTRTTTVFALHGDGETGYGEDVTYDSDEHYGLDVEFDLAGEYSFDGFSSTAGRIDLFPGREPDQSVFRSYRRWGVESAALDLALKQSDTNLGEQLGRVYDPVRFVVSTRLGEPPSFDRVGRWLEIDPDTEFKLDATAEWTHELVARLDETGAVRTVDLKGLYDDTDVDVSPDAELYRMVVEELPDVLVEDPALTDETRKVFEGHEDRVTWDYPIRGVESVEDLPWEPDWLNIKPSRFGSVESVLDTVDYCEENGIRMYGGGQFELGVGRRHLHAVASLFYPDGPNDVAPVGYNAPEPREGLPSSPLEPPEETRGIGW